MPARLWHAAGSVNKQDWKIAILRHRTAPDAAVWLDYDSIPESTLKSHYHFDAMNLGLYAKGLDLLPEFGYPAVQFGDWHTPQALWHKKTAAHNTVVVDGKDQAGGPAETTLWQVDGPVQVIRASSPSQIGGTQYERTVAMVETGPADFYVLDVFRVAGGTDHAKFTHTAFAAAQPFGVKLGAAETYGHDSLIRDFRMDARPAEAWGVDWKIEDRYGYRKPGAPDVHLRYIDLTRGAGAYTAESWTVESSTSTVEYWIPTVMARRQAPEGELKSTFVSLLDPYEGARPQVMRVRRLDREGDAAVRVEVELRDGRRDVLTAGADGVTLDRRE